METCHVCDKISFKASVCGHIFCMNCIPAATITRHENHVDLYRHHIGRVKLGKDGIVCQVRSKNTVYVPGLCPTCFIRNAMRSPNF